MLNLKAILTVAFGVLVLIFALNADLRADTKGQSTVNTVRAKTVLAAITVLAAPVLVYNHFTHANDGPINPWQIVLLITSALFWGFVLERLTHSTSSRKGGGAG